ncbi:hypothetical protein GQ53DRAFT_744727 [Thozetella sp. PMI_491]|nr:hypothetical protein GQ53DRAFT_744727 [Thozetella sp. PMI_491]
MALPIPTLGWKPSPDVAEDVQQKVLDKAKAAKEAQEAADVLSYQASLTSDETERDTLLTESKKKEKEAHGHSKEARRIASGAWQGTVGGAGIGSTVGAGLGAVVGTLVGTIATIPIAGLGALIGLPVGLIHGPFFKTDPGQLGRTEAPSEDEQHRAVIQALELAEKKEKEGESKEEGKDEEQ